MKEKDTQSKVLVVSDSLNRELKEVQFENDCLVEELRYAAIYCEQLREKMLGYQTLYKWRNLVMHKRELKKIDSGSDNDNVIVIAVLQENIVQLKVNKEMEIARCKEEFEQYRIAHDDELADIQRKFALMCLTIEKAGTESFQFVQKASDMRRDNHRLRQQLRKFHFIFLLIYIQTAASLISSTIAFKSQTSAFRSLFSSTR